MARIVALPIEPLEIEFADGTILTAVFDNEAFMRYSDEFGDLGDAFEEIEENPYDIYAQILYCGLKKRHSEITLDEATRILLTNDQEMIMEIARLLIDNFNLKTNEETGKKFRAILKKSVSKEEYQQLQNLGIV